MSGRKLGKGLDALISMPEKEVVTDNSITDKKITDKSTSDQLSSISPDILNKAFEDGKKNPRVVVWSPRSSMVLRVLKKSIPEFSISKEASTLLEEAIKRKYPEIWKEVDKYFD